MNKKDFIGGNGDASVVYSSKDINGEKTQSMKINGKEVDFTDPKSVEEAKEYFKNAKHGSAGWLCKVFGIDFDNICDNAIESLDKKHKKVLEAKKTEKVENDTFDWGIVPWNKDAWKFADDYLMEKFGNEYENLSDKEQYRMLKTVAESFEWLLNKESFEWLLNKD